MNFTTPNAVSDNLLNISEYKPNSSTNVDKSRLSKYRLKKAELFTYKLYSSLINRYNIKNTTENISKKIKSVITVAENDGLKDKRFFIKEYTGYIIKETAIPNINGKKYTIKIFNIKKATVNKNKKIKYGLYLEISLLILTPHFLKYEMYKQKNSDGKY